MMKKVISAIGIIMLMATMLVGCGKGATFDGSKTGDGDHFDIEFKVLNTSFSHDLELKEGESLDVSVTKESGEISLLIQNGEEEPAYRGDSMDTSDFKVTVSADGTYTVTVTGKKAKGHVVVKRSDSSVTEDASAIDVSSAIEVISEALAEPASEPVTEADTETERSPFDLWEYEGYVDECNTYTWQEEFLNCDYDGDGKTDRLSRSWIEDKETAIYTIEFGNGEKLVTPEGWETGFPHIQSGDLDGDGEKEILVTLTYDTSTDPYSFGEMWLFDRASGEYVEAELPLVKIENGAKGFNVDYEKPEDNKITFTIREAGLKRTEEVDEDYLSNWWSEDLTTQQRPVFYAEIIDESNPVLRCYVAPLHRWGPMMGFNLNYVNGKYEIGYIELDSPDSWG